MGKIQKENGAAIRSTPLNQEDKTVKKSLTLVYLISSTEPFFSYDSLGRDLVR